MIEGSLSEFALNDILQMISLGGKSGELFLTGETPFGKKSGKIYFEKGEIKSAETNKSKGNTAIIDLLNIEEGTFKFTAMDVSHIKKTVEKSIPDLILLATSKLDEWSKVKKRISSIDSVFVLSDEDIPEEIHLSPLEWQIIALFGKRHSIEEVAVKLNTAAIDVSKIAYKLIMLKIIKEVGKKKMEQKKVVEEKTIQRGSIFRRTKGSKKP